MRGRRGRSLLPAVAVLASVAVVVVAATGSTPVGTGDARPPSELVLDTFFSLTLVLLVVAAGLFVYALTQRRAIAQEIASGRYPRTGLLAWLLFACLFAVFAWLGYRRVDRPLPESPVIDVGAPRRANEPGDALSNTADYQAEFAWVPVLVVVSLALLAVLAWVLAGRRQRAQRATGDGELAEQLADVLDDTLDDLRAEHDPRRAVVAAFARLERALAAAGVPRAAAETADEYVPRVLAELAVDADAVQTLSRLFAEAKFSRHDIDDAMKAEAIAALESVRDDLRVAARRETGLVVRGRPHGETPVAL
jgi:hypothetical protein